MLAKLFDDIGIASFIHSTVLTLAFTLLVYFVSGPSSVSIGLIHYTWSLPGYWAAILATPLILFSSLWFNFIINSIPLFKRDYQLCFVLAILLIPVLITQGSLDLILLLPLIVLFLSRQLALGENPAIAYLLFDSGTLIGLMLFFEPLSWVFLLVLWLGLVNYGHFGLKQILIPVLGLLAIWFVVCSVLYWTAGISEVVSALGALVNLPQANLPVWSENLWRISPLVILLIPSFLELLGAYGKVKVLQSKSFGFLMIMFIAILVAGAVFYNPAGLWIWMAFPTAVLVVNLINALKRRWLKELAYLLLLSYLLLFLI